MAVYCEKIGLLYISAWMTGCTSVEKFLRENYGGVVIGEKHESLDNTINLLKERGVQTSALFKVTNVRNPYDTMVSIYHKNRYRYYPEFVNNGCYPEWMHQDEQKHCTWAGVFDLSFKQYAMCTNTIISARFIRDERFDHYMTFEGLAVEVDRMLLKLGVKNKYPLPHVNKTHGRKRNFRQYYTPKIKAIVGKNSRNYLAFTGYTFYGKPKFL